MSEYTQADFQRELKDVNRERAMQGIRALSEKEFADLNPEKVKRLPPAAPQG